MLVRYSVIIEYCGTNFCGMQRQPGLKTICSIVEDAVSKFLDNPTQIRFAGRTDAGVHATGQVIDFVSPVERPLWKVVFGINFYLKKANIVCISAKKVNLNFHSRFDAVMRHYVYTILNRDAPLTFQSNTCMRVGGLLNLEKMSIASKLFIGRHNFMLFRSSCCQSPSSVKTINDIRIVSSINDHGYVEIKIFVSAKSFLHNMVRRIVGSLIDVGLGSIDISDISDMLKGVSSKLPKTAESQGLVLLRVDY